MCLRNEGYACRVFVDSAESAARLLGVLSGAFVFKTSEPMQETHRHNWCSFRVPYGPRLTHRNLSNLLSSIPGVRVGADVEQDAPDEPAHGRQTQMHK